MTGNPEPARGTSTSLPPTSSFRPWHLFATAAMLAATLAVVVARPPSVVVLIMLTLPVASAAFVGLMVYRTVRPLMARDFEEATPMVGSRSRAAVDREKTLVLRSIKELEFDRAMGKVADDDFAEIQRRLRLRALGLMKQLDTEAVDFLAVIERELAERLGADAPLERESESVAVETAEDASSLALVGTCLSCGTRNDEDARFCKKCGEPLGNDVGTE